MIAKSIWIQSVGEPAQPERSGMEAGHLKASSGSLRANAVQFLARTETMAEARIAPVDADGGTRGMGF